jgi:hypothetical protein
MKELCGLLSYIYLLQSSIDHYSRLSPIVASMIVYRGISSGASTHVSLYMSMIGEIIVWRSFASTSRSPDLVITSFIKGEDSVLFEIELRPGSVVADISRFSVSRHEEEVLIAAASGFVVVSVDEIVVDKFIQGVRTEVVIPRVRLRYCIDWQDLGVDIPPQHFIIE